MFLESSSDSSASLLADKPTEEDARNCYNFNKNKPTPANSFNFGHHHSFEDENIQRHYGNFRITRVSRSVLVLWILYLLTNGVGLVKSFTMYTDIWVARIFLFCRIIIALVGVFNYFNIFHMRVHHDASRKDFHQYVSFVTNTSNFIIISIAMVNGLIYAWKSSLGSCLDVDESTNENHIEGQFSYDCNPSYEIGGTPTHSMMILIAGNIVLITTLPCHSLWAAWINYVVTCVSVITAAILSPDFFSSVSVILTALFTIAIYNGVEDNSITMFKTLLDLESTSRVQMRELKQFIGNVAHDLKVRYNSSYFTLL
jgi:hypothetical protein